jgi:hypothetical protein
MMTALLIISLIIGIITAWPTMAASKAGGLRHLDFDRRKALENHGVFSGEGHAGPKPGEIHNGQNPLARFR